MKKLLAVLLFLVFQAIFLRGILFEPGIVIGSDWSLPLTSEQMSIFGRKEFFTWSNNTFGARAPHLNTYLFSFFVSFFPKIGIEGAVFSKILLVFLLSLIGFSAFYFCRKIGLSFKSSLLAGFIYMTTPLVFNYSIMGWIFILLVMAVMPFFLWTFWLSIKKGEIKYSIIAGLLFAIAMFQSQSAFWFPLLMIVSFPFLVFSRKQFFIFIRSFLIIFFIVLAVHANWLFPLVFSPSAVISKTVSVYDIGRFEIRLSFINILRLWGGLFNYQFETVYPRVLLPISFVLPIFAFWALILRRKDKRVLHLAAIALLPLIIYSLRGVLYHLPFSNVIRDFGRMMVLSAFPYSVLAAITFEEMGRLKMRFVSKFLIAMVVLLVFLNSLPFWLGELYGESRIDYDQRLRTLEFPHEYEEIETILSKDLIDTKALWLPSGMSLAFLDNKKFYGPYKEVADIFALLSQKPGAFAFSDKTVGPSVDYGKLILRTIEDSKLGDLEGLLKLTPMNTFVIRKNAYGAGGKGPEIEKTIEKLPDIVKVFDRPKISIYRNNNFLPHFYLPQNIVYSNGEIGDLIDIVSFWDYEIRSEIYLAAKQPEINGNMVAEGDRNMHPSDAKLRNKEILNRADEVFVKVDLENAVDEDYFEKKESIRNSVPLPHVKHKPGSLGWSLARLKEKYYEWKVKKDPEEWIEKKLFYVSKRISEFEKWGGEKDTEYLILDTYREKMGEVIEEIGNLRSEDAGEDMVIKIRAYWEVHQEKLESIIDSFYQEEKKERVLELVDEVFAQLDKKIEPLEKKFDLRNLEYSFEIPREGNYELFIETDKADETLITQTGMVVDGEMIATGVGEVRENGWISLGKRDFKEGKHKLVLHLPEPENLVGDNWQELKEVQIKEEGIEFSLQGFFPNAQNLGFQKIDNWQKDTLYYLSFDYKTEGGSLGVGILEEKTEYQEKEKAVKTEKIFEKVLKSREIKKLRNWEKFEVVIKSNPEALGATIYLYALAEPDQVAKVDFKHMRIYKIVYPKLVLRMRADNAERRLITPRITFIKINPTKYRVKVEGAKEPYTLVFSESFHKGWKAYINKIQNGYGEIVASYFDGEVKERTHRNIFLNRNTFETWGKESIAEDRHYLVNSYANSWYITPEDSNGREDYELIIEFRPQRLFYIGFAVSGITLLGCLGYLGYNFVKKRKR